MPPNNLPIKLIVFDFDGVMTDNCVYVSEDGIESVKCNRSDGLGIQMLREKRYQMLILSTEENNVVKARATKLKLDVIHGCANKLETLQKHCSNLDIDPKKVCFVGNDINDLEVMKWVGLSVCPADAYPQIIEISDLILTRNGGDAVVRELADLLTKGDM